MHRSILQRIWLKFHCTVFVFFGSFTVFTFFFRISNTCGQDKQPPIEFPDLTCTSLIVNYCFYSNHLRVVCYNVMNSYENNQWYL
jgi:hypothetical protein